MPIKSFINIIYSWPKEPSLSQEPTLIIKQELATLLKNNGYDTWNNTFNKIKKYIKSNSYHNGKNIQIPQNDPYQKVLKFKDTATLNNMAIYISPFIEGVYSSNAYTCKTCGVQKSILKYNQDYYCSNVCFEHV